MHGQVHVYLPSSGHPAHGTVRVIVKDASDDYEGAESRVWLDSDGQIGSNQLRNTPRNNFTDGEWHMVTVTSQPDGKKVCFLSQTWVRSVGLRDITWRSCLQAVKYGVGDRDADVTQYMLRRQWWDCAPGHKAPLTILGR